MYETILSPINYGGVQLKNRIIFAPTTFGLPEEEYFAKIRAIAQGGCAMIIVGDVPVGKSRFEKSLFDAKGFAFYQKIVKIAHDADCKVCAQLHQSDSNLLAMFKYIPGVLLKKITPDQLREKLNEEVAPYITNLPQRKIHEILRGFGKAAVLAKQAGFDLVQVHGDRMCGSFSSAIFNHRTDEYGGSAENRARFAVEAVKADAGKPLGVGEHHPARQPPLFQPAGVFPQILRCGAAVHRPPPLRGGRLERPGLCGAAACRRTHPVCCHEPPASGRPGLGEQAEKRAGRADPPLCPLQQKVSGRPDGTSGNPLHL